MNASLMRLRDGRELSWAEMGDPAGYPVFAFHGTPGSRRQVLVDPAPALAAGARMIAPDRPGRGASTWQSRRTFAGWARDVAELADHLGIDRFAVLGISGGGPDAAVCARFLPDRVSSAALVSGVGSLAEPGSEAGMMTANRMFARLARDAPAVNAVIFGLIFLVGRRAPERVLPLLANSMPAVDTAVLSRPEVRSSFLSLLSDASPTAGRAAAQDFRLFARDWGFRLEDISVPVQVWQGDVGVNVPVAHAERQAAAIPGAVLHMVPGEGHLMSFDHFEEILRELLASRN
ncbi:alpha/beta fold hydrolase [Mycobacterium stomatepiae]|nr:alpha/beta hydrolase [Mycobacterium stomatepiae]MCV7165401.1 alpha/beta hydrolase [Mycobacterium stomatepiae]